MIIRPTTTNRFRGRRSKYTRAAQHHDRARLNEVQREQERAALMAKRRTCTHDWEIISKRIDGSFTERCRDCQSERKGARQ